MDPTCRRRFHVLPWIQTFDMWSVPSRNSLYLNFSVQKTVSISHLCRRGCKELMLCVTSNPPCVSVSGGTNSRTSVLPRLNLSEGFWTADSDPALDWTDSTWMFSNCVSSCSCEPTCFLHCAPQHDGRTESVCVCVCVCVCVSPPLCLNSSAASEDEKHELS